MTRYVALPVLRCGCGRERVSMTPGACEVCRDPVSRRKARWADAAMDMRDEAVRIARALEQPEQTTLSVAHRFGVSRKVVLERLELLGRLG